VEDNILIRKSMVCLVSLLLSAPLLFAHPGDTLWTRTYGGRALDFARSVQQTDDGGYVIAGFTSPLYGDCDEDGYIVRADAGGNVIWAKRYGGFSNERLYHVIVTSDGGFAAIGHQWVHHRYGMASWDVFLLKIDADGDVQWTRTYGGNQDDQGRCVLQTVDGGYLVCGMTKSFGAGKSGWVIRTDAYGNVRWTRIYGEAEPNQCYTIIESYDSLANLEGYVLAGYSGKNRGGSCDCYVIKIDQNGDIYWIRTFGSSAYWEEIYSVVQTDDGGYLCCGGRQMTHRDTCLQAAIMKLDSEGRTVWIRNYGRENVHDYFSSACPTGDGGFVLAGITGCENWATRVTGNVYIVKTDGAGYILWDRIYGANQGEHARAVLQSRDGAYVVAGRTYGFGTRGSCDFWLLKLAGDLRPAEFSIEMIPNDYPIHVPPGGEFSYTGILRNLTPVTMIIDQLWLTLILPRNIYQLEPPLELLENVRLAPHEQISYYNIIQAVPDTADYGRYTLLALGGQYHYGLPATVLAADHFNFTVDSTVTENNPDWRSNGWFRGCDSADNVPADFSSAEAYPNPFNTATSIFFNLLRSGNTVLDVYNLAGQKVVTLLDGYMQAGRHEVRWDASPYSSGIYFYKLISRGEILTGRMTLLK
jgi:hypothetical protein